MWTKTVKIKYKNWIIDVMLFLSDSTEENKEVVEVRSMFNEYYLIEQIHFQSRDAAYDFIKHYTVSMAKAFFIREGYGEGAIQ